MLSLVIWVGCAIGSPLKLEGDCFPANPALGFYPPYVGFDSVPAMVAYSYQEKWPSLNIDLVNLLPIP